MFIQPIKRFFVFGYESSFLHWVCNFNDSDKLTNRSHVTRISYNPDRRTYVRSDMLCLGMFRYSSQWQRPTPGSDLPACSRGTWPHYHINELAMGRHGLIKALVIEWPLSERHGNTRAFTISRSCSANPPHISRQIILIKPSRLKLTLQIAPCHILSLLPQLKY